MASPAQTTANAANAQHSTGPRTPEGKIAAAQNSRTHGFTARNLVIAVDEQPEFESLRNALASEIKPEGELENIEFDLLLHAAWNLHRISKQEASLMHGERDPLLDPSVQKDSDRLAIYYSRTERSFYRAMRELRALQTDRALRNAMIHARQVAVATTSDSRPAFPRLATATTFQSFARSVSQPPASTTPPGIGTA